MHSQVLEAVTMEKYLRCGMTYAMPLFETNINSKTYKQQRQQYSEFNK